jgi:DNA-directed RNA polymerase II subunit RPB1
MPHEVFDIVKPYLAWFKERNMLVWALVLQSCAAKRLAVEFKLGEEDIKNLMDFFKNKYERTLIPAGEMVGTLAAQSLGEPVTQMTLDTFHHAGNAAKDVTLGVPRFEELINASEILKRRRVVLYSTTQVLVK